MDRSGYRARLRHNTAPLGRLIAPLIFAAAIVLSAGAHAASYISRCPAADGVTDTVMLGTSPARQSGCVARAIALDPQAVRALVPAPAQPAGAATPQEVTLTGKTIAHGFTIEDIATTPPLVAAPPYLVPGLDLRGVAGVHAFGPAGMAALAAGDNGLTLDCTPGSEPAGLAFSTTLVPPIPGLTLRIVHRAEQDFRLVAAPPTATHKSLTGRAPRMLATLQANDSLTESHVALPADLAAETPVEIEALCPSQGGHLAMDEIVLETQSQPSSAQTPSAQASPTPDRAGWVRDPTLWQSSAPWLFAHAQRWGLTRLYINLPVDDAGRFDAQTLAGFITEASARAIAVWILLSEPRDAAARDALAHTGRALADYNASVTQEAQIKGVQIETASELAGSYWSDPTAKALRFLDTLARAKPAIGLPLDAALPPWFPVTVKQLAVQLAQDADSVTVFAGSTDSQEISRRMAPFLAWGTRQNRAVHIALEAGPLDDAEQRHFIHAAEGELWLLPLGEGHVLVLLDAPVSGLSGAAFRQDGTTELPTSARSFFGRSADLREALEPIGRSLGVWPSFAGLAFHGLFRIGN